MRLVPHPQNANEVILYNGKGRGEAYQVVASDFTAPAFHFRKLVRSTNDRLELREADGLIREFFALDNSPNAGKLSARTTRCGNRITFEYNQTGQLVIARDSLSRPITFEYDNVGRLVKLH